MFVLGEQGEGGEVELEVVLIRTGFPKVHFWKTNFKMTPAASVDLVGYSQVNFKNKCIMVKKVNGFY